MRVFFWVCFLVLLPFTQLLGQKKYPSPQFRHFTIHDSYTHNGFICDIQTDSKGYLWVVQQFHVLKYDGNKFIKADRSRVTSSMFLRFYESDQGVKFVTALTGELFFINEQDELIPYEYNDTLKKLNINRSPTDVFFDEENRLHISFSSKGYFLIDNGEVTQPLKEKDINGFACILRKNQLPFMVQKTKKGEKQAYYYYLYNDDLELIEKRPVSKRKYLYPNSITRLPNKNFLFSSGWGNLLEFNQDGFVQEIEYEHPIFRLFCDSYDNLWVGTMTEGLHQYKNATISLSNRKTLIKNAAAVTAEDYEGGLWLYSTLKGLSYIQNPAQVYYNKQQKLILDNKVNVIQAVGSKLYCAYRGNKASVIDTKNNTLDSLILPPLNVNPKTLTRLIRYDSNNQRFWVSRKGSLYYSTDKGWSRLSTKKLPDFVKGQHLRQSSYLARSNYSFAVGYANRFFLLKDTNIVYISNDLKQKVGRVSMNGDSAAIFTDDGLYIEYKKEVTRLKDLNPTFEEMPSNITVFQNKIWCAFNQKGIFVLEKDSISQIKINDIAFDFPSLIPKNQDSLFILAENGTFLFSSKGTPNHPSGYRLSAFKAIPRDGNSHSSKNKQSIFFATSDRGMLRVDFNAILNAPLKTPKLYFTQLKIDNTIREPLDSSFSLQYNEDFIQINYSGISFQNKPLNYRHRMLGLRDEWIETSERYTQFTTLPSGNYTFEVQARIGEQIWGPSLFLHFEIFPPFWETWWFLLSALLLLILIIYQISLLRFKAIKREQDLLIKQLQAEQKALQAQMDPHFVFNIISSAQYLITDGEKEKANQFLDMFADSMRNILDQANTNQITIENEIQFLTEYIQMERFRLEEHFDYELVTHLSKIEQQQVIPPFIIQPFVENAIQHGLKNREEKGNLKLTFQLKQQFLTVTIEDNGIGRKEASSYKKHKNGKESHGIRIIKERLALHNDKKENIFLEDLYSSTQKAQGTRVTITIRY